VIKFQVSLDFLSFRALRTLAEREYRDPRAQAALIIRQELQRRGLLIHEGSIARSLDDAQDDQNAAQ
jgi:hypothetical protein